MNAPSRHVFLVDDDAGVRTAMMRVLHAEGMTVSSFESAEAFLARPDAATDGCLVLDVAMSGLDGLALQQHLASIGQALPTIFVSGSDEIPVSVRAMKAGAVDFLTKPVPAAVLVAAVRGALAAAVQSRAGRAEMATLHARLAILTPRECEVLAALVEGRLNKQIAGDLGIVEQTVKFHRGRIMEKMQAKTVAELMHMAAKLQV